MRLLAASLVALIGHGALAAAPPPIAPAPSVAAFVGVADCDGHQGSKDKGRGCEPVRLETADAFDQRFPTAGPCKTDSSVCAAARMLQLAVRGYFHNGGAALLVVPFARVPEAGETERALARLPRDVVFFAAPGRTDLALQTVLVRRAEASSGLAVLDGPADPATDPTTVVQQEPASAAAAFYYPWLAVRDPLTRRTVATPPSGHVTGLLASLEPSRRFAVGSRTLSGVEGLLPAVDRARADALRAARIDVPPVVALRGAGSAPVTLAEAGEDHYVALVLLRGFFKRSIAAGTTWVASSPNEPATWSALNLQIQEFFYDQWRQGALVGSRPDQAFFVRCDRTTMTQNDLDAGRTVVVYGYAPVKPAEFVVDRLVVNR